MTRWGSPRKPKALLGMAMSLELSRTWPSRSPPCESHPQQLLRNPSRGFVVHFPLFWPAADSHEPTTTPLPVHPWDQSPTSSLFDTSPEAGVDKTLETTAVLGKMVQVLAHSGGRGPVHPRGRRRSREGPTLPILIVHLLLIRVLESLAVPAVPVTETQGSEGCSCLLLPPAAQRQGEGNVLTYVCSAQK